MSVLRPKPPEDPISLRLGPLASEASRQLARLPAVPRDTVAAALRPGQLLDHYMRDRPTSGLFRVLGEARQLREAVDAVAVVCREPLGHAIQGLFETCCHPFHNALSRGERGGRPRLFFDVGPFNPDQTAGLLDLLAASRGDDLLDRWGWVRLASIADGPSPTLADDADRIPGLLGVRSAGGGPRPCVFQQTPAGPTADVFCPAVLVTASVAGIDVVRFLGGGVAMLRRFLEAPAEANPVLLLAAAMQAAAAAPQAGRIELDVTHAPAATAIARWWASQHPQEGGPQHGCLLRIEQPRREAIPPAPQPATGRTADEASCGRLAIDLPRLDEHTIGQLLALRLLALRLLAQHLAEA